MKIVRPGTGSAKWDDRIGRALIDMRSIAGGRGYRKFVVVGIARTGSTLLLSLLNSHPNALAFGEIFRGDGRIGWDTAPFGSRQSPALLQRIETRPIDFIEEQIFRRWPRELHAVGFKLFYYHARQGAQAAVWDTIRDDPEIAIIHIKRDNILEQLLSLRNAERTNMWSASVSPSNELEPLRLDPEACRLHFEEVRAYENACDAFFEGRSITTISYEELVADRAAAMGKICAKLNLSPQPMEARIARQRTTSLSQSIANFEELRATFAGSPWAHFFDEGAETLAGQRVA
jgi:LPS sulfotransferase NodH